MTVRIVGQLDMLPSLELPPKPHPIALDFGCTATARSSGHVFSVLASKHDPLHRNHPGTCQLRVCRVDPIKTSSTSHGPSLCHLLAATPYLPSPHTAQYRENLDLHHQQRLNNTSSTVSTPASASASAIRRPPSTIHPSAVVDNNRGPRLKNGQHPRRRRRRRERRSS
ncbi:hypothetical protein CHU98_g6944 [Xylaria longipes]|nr:hypothetical protein CHU98_g6944 [Xylaria longipes]